MPDHWGRAWRVTVTTNEQPFNEIFTFGSQDWQPESIHVKFDTVQAIGAWWYCDVVIYNLNAPTQQNMILYGMKCKVEAGYRSPELFATIFEGNVFQPMWELENGIDWKLTLRCVVGLFEVGDNFVSTTIGAGMTQRQLVAAMAQRSRYPLDISNVDELKSPQSSRHTTFFGQTDDFLQPIADDNNCVLWYESMKANMIKFINDDNTIHMLTYGSDNGLIGTPQMTQDGVLVKVLLDPRAQLAKYIQLNPTTAIRQVPRVIGNLGSYRTLLDQNSSYIIARVHHYGDTRGNDWYTEITGVINAASLLSILASY